MMKCARQNCKLLLAGVFSMISLVLLELLVILNSLVFDLGFNSWYWYWIFLELSYQPGPGILGPRLIFGWYEACIYTWY
jgi:hypothetical protein